MSEKDLDKSVEQELEESDDGHSLKSEPKEQD